MLKFKKAERKIKILVFLLSTPLLIGSFYMDSFDQFFLYEKNNPNSSSSIQQRTNTEKSIHFKDSSKQLSIHLQARNSLLEIIPKDQEFSLKEKLSDLTLKTILVDEQKKDIHNLTSPSGEFSFKNRHFTFNQVEFSTSTQDLSTPIEKKIVQAHAKKMELFFNKKPFRMKAHEMIGHIKDEL